MATDPRDLAKQDRQWAQQHGQDLMNQAGQNAEENRQQTDYLGNRLDQWYAPDAAGNGGYTPDEAAQIERTPQLDALQQTEEQRQANYLTPQEQANIAGDPYAAMKYYNPQLLTGLQGASADAQQNDVAGLRQGLNDAVDKNALSLNPDYQKSQADVLNGGDSAVANTLKDTAGRTRAAINPGTLQQSSDAAGQIKMTPEQQQQMVTAAGISAGTAHQAAVGDMERRAAAAGSSPMGVAAFRERDARNAAADAGDAMTQARVSASNAAASRALEGESQRLGAEQYLSGSEVANERNIGANTNAAQQESINRRLATQQGTEQMRLGTAQDIANRERENASEVGQTQLGTDVRIGQQQQDVNRYNQETAMNATAQGEQQAANRAAGLAQNRQGSEQYNQNTGYQRGMGVAQQESGAAQNVAGTRLGQQNTARNYYTGTQQMYNQNQQGDLNRQAGIYGTSGQLQNQATGTYAGYQASKDSRPGLFGQIAGAATGAAAAFLADGGIVTEPTDAVLGEQGPEAVVPLKNRVGTALQGFSRGMGYGSQGNPGMDWSKIGSNVGTAIQGYRAKHRNLDAQGVTGDGSAETGGVNAALNTGSYLPTPANPPDVSSPMADGQVVTQPTRALIGEQGPEAVVPLTPRPNARVRPSAAAGGPNIDLPQTGMPRGGTMQNNYGWGMRRPPAQATPGATGQQYGSQQPYGSPQGMQQLGQGMNPQRRGRNFYGEAGYAAA